MDFAKFTDGDYRLTLPCGRIVVFDKSDCGLLLPYRWVSYKGDNTHSWYAKAWIGSRRIRMHRFILGAKPGELVDHRDLDGLNNRRSNIRICTPQQNRWNCPQRTGRFKGVYWCKAWKKWIAAIRIGNKRTILGGFNVEEDAARAFDHAARIHHGEFAFLNFPTEVTA